MFTQKYKVYFTHSLQILLYANVQNNLAVKLSLRYRAIFRDFPTTSIQFLLQALLELDNGQQIFKLFISTDVNNHGNQFSGSLCCGKLLLYVFRDI